MNDVKSHSSVKSGSSRVHPDLQAKGDDGCSERRDPSRHHEAGCCNQTGLSADHTKGSGRNLEEGNEARDKADDKRHRPSCCSP